MNTGKLIALEGLSPARDDLLHRLHTELVALSVPVKLLPPRKRADDITSQLITTVLEDDRYRAHSLLSNATTANQHNKIARAQTDGVTCLITHSSLANLITDYYGLGVVNDYQFLSALADFAANEQTPDLTIVLDTTASSQAVAHMAQLGLPTQPNEALFERMRAGYLWEARQHNFPVVYVTDDTNAAFEEIWQHVAELLGITHSTLDTAKPQSIAEVLAGRPAQKSEPSTEQSEPSPIVAEHSGSHRTHAEASATTSSAPGKTTLGPVSVLVGLHAQQLHRPVAHSFAAAYDHKDQAGHYRYYIPAELTGKVRSQYIRSFNQIFDTYSAMVTSLKEFISHANRPESEAYDMLRNVLPVAATGTLDVPPSQLPLTLPQALPETKQLGKHAVADTRPSVLTSLANNLLPPVFAAESDAAALTRFTPRNELDLVCSIMLGYSDIPTKQLDTRVAHWTYQQKVDIFTTYCRDAPRAALEEARYNFDIITPVTALHTLLAKPYLQGIQWQIITPRLGYDVPKLIEEAGLADDYEHCFDLSLELASALHDAKGPVVAQYAALQGHKVRWNCSLSGHQAFELVRELTSLQRADDTPQPLQQIFEKIAEVHPLLAKAIAASHSAGQQVDTLKNTA
jgi:thymidylate kinase